MLHPERVVGVPQDQELEIVLCAGSRLPRCEKLAPPPFQLRAWLSDLGLGGDAALDALARLSELLLREPEGLLAHPDFETAGCKLPVGALDIRNGLGNRAPQGGDGSLAVRDGGAHGEPGGVHRAIAQERLPQLHSHLCSVCR